MKPVIIDSDQRAVLVTDNGETVLEFEGVTQKWLLRRWQNTISGVHCNVLGTWSGPNAEQEARAAFQSICDAVLGKTEPEITRRALSLLRRLRDHAAFGTPPDDGTMREVAEVLREAKA